MKRRARLRLNPFWQDAWRFGSVWHLADDEDKAVHFNGVLKGATGFGPPAIM